tara:strand:+ start:83 stop:1867 length:1785 start_codon:yes stop_codon:yes gene_type:complete
MCGIAGIVSLKRSELPEKGTIAKMLSEIRYRGPDDTGVFYDNSCHIGNNRLSIIDIEGGHQPITVQERYTIVYNGEIYNYKEIRSELEKRQVKFKTNSDTEVILRGFIAKGTDFLDELNGIFSFAIWDSKKCSLLIVRDHMGIKPLYYSNNGKYFVFGSEIKSIFESGLIDKSVNTNSIFEYFCRGSARYLETMYSQVNELEPGTWMKVDVLGNIRTGKYFHLEEDWRNINVPFKDEKELSVLLSDKLEECVNRQLISDVPLGILLSGGIDSSLLLKFMTNSYSQPLHAFTYTNEVDELNELDKAIAMVNSLDSNIYHHTLSVNTNEQLVLFDEACKILDSPVGYPSSISILLISRLAQSKRIKVVLSGQGADELFLGYKRYYRWIKEGLLSNPNIEDWAHHFYFGGGADKIGRVERLTQESRDVIDDSLAYRWVIDHQELPPLKRMSLFDQKFRLLDLLKRDDRMGMGGSVEIRVPFFDKEMVSYVNSIDDHYKLNGNIQKYILKKIAKGILPKKIIEATKLGSPSDITHWIQSSSESIQALKSLITVNESFTKNHLSLNEVNNLISDHEKTSNFAHLCWCLFSIEHWYQNSF